MLRLGASLLQQIPDGRAESRLPQGTKCTLHSISRVPLGQLAVYTVGSESAQLSYTLQDGELFACVR